MLPRVSPLIRTIQISYCLPARKMTRAAPLPLALPEISAFSVHHSSQLVIIGKSNHSEYSSLSNSSLFTRRFHALCRGDEKLLKARSGTVFASNREYRKLRRKPVKKKEKELELNVSICIEEELPDDTEILHETRETAIQDVGGFQSVELSVLLCNDEFIRKLNKEWRDEDHATDVLSMSQHVPELKLPILMLGDIVISVETAAKQAEERGHTLLDEIRILMVG
ncbi:uncharacterized protein LOC110821909 isoform X2 [Carica papaya]|uniref:uncharacterized protein LOC110821909 isoform X2 n=1 Tax=Carica papaya TaxID=3649 RepID=UPI000B8CFC61|nr:uncharacterized protein LOC110821909 isoform X2 [Carica papaya]